MMDNDFEQMFSCFLERQEYDEAQGALFDIVRAAFLAGWQAAGGTPPVPQKIFELIPCRNDPGSDAQGATTPAEGQSRP